MSFLRLKKRSQFLQVSSQGRRIYTPLFILAYLKTEFPAHFGLVVTKKMGNAVARNRIKRRVRAAIDKTLPHINTPLHGYYVIISKPCLLTEPFLKIEETMLMALQKTV